jgi:hypothetical protein
MTGQPVDDWLWLFLVQAKQEWPLSPDERACARYARQTREAERCVGKRRASAEEMEMEMEMEMGAATLVPMILASRGRRAGDTAHTSCSRSQWPRRMWTLSSTGRSRTQ